jgi:hypothetical protein
VLAVSPWDWWAPYSEQPIVRQVKIKVRETSLCRQLKEENSTI